MCGVLPFPQPVLWRCRFTSSYHQLPGFPPCVRVLRNPMRYSPGIDADEPRLPWTEWDAMRTTALQGSRLMIPFDFLSFPFRFFRKFRLGWTNHNPTAHPILFLMLALTPIPNPKLAVVTQIATHAGTLFVEHCSTVVPAPQLWGNGTAGRLLVRLAQLTQDPKFLDAGLPTLRVRLPFCFSF